MTAYSSQIASAAALIAQKGAPITFTRTVNAYDERSGDTVPTRATASTVAVRVKATSSDVARMEAENLVISKCITLLVAASGLTFDPKPGDALVFAGVPYVARTADPLAPDGTPIIRRVIGSV